MPDDIWAVEPAGRTDREIARMVLRGHGVDDARIDRRTAEWIALAESLHESIAANHPSPVAAPDADEVTGRLLDEGAEIALVTGNLEAIGRQSDRQIDRGGGFSHAPLARGNRDDRPDIGKQHRPRAGRAARGGRAGGGCGFGAMRGQHGGCGNHPWYGAGGGLLRAQHRFNPVVT